MPLSHQAIHHHGMHHSLYLILKIVSHFKYDIKIMFLQSSKAAMKDSLNQYIYVKDIELRW